MVRSPLKSIRRYCLWCCKDQPIEVELCPAVECPIHSLRFGKGVKGITVLKSIRNRCIDCSGFIDKEVKNCKFDGIKDKFCDLYPYRMSKNPNYNPKRALHLARFGFKKKSVIDGGENEKELILRIPCPN